MNPDLIIIDDPPPTKRVSRWQQWRRWRWYCKNRRKVFRGYWSRDAAGNLTFHKR